MLLAGLLGIISSGITPATEKIVKYQPKSGPLLWPSEPPESIPFEQSKELVGILFTGKHSDYRVADTWYPSWASDDNLYSPWTDGTTDGIRSSSGGPNATTGQAIIMPIPHIVQPCYVFQHDTMGTDIREWIIGRPGFCSHFTVGSYPVPVGDISLVIREKERRTHLIKMVKTARVIGSVDSV